MGTPLARSDLLIGLVRAAQAGDSASIRRIVEALAADERRKQHHVLAERLESELEVSQENLEKRPSSPHEETPSLVERTPRVTLKDVVLRAPVEDAVRRFIEEHMRADVLRSHALEPRNKILLAGPPGNGKTTVTEAISYELGQPLYVVHYESLIASFLGETGTRLARLFEFVRKRQCVLFFDEFDTIGKERGDEHETGEIKRVVSSLLLQVDDLPSYVTVIAATNHPELLDRAVWRRFQLRLFLGQPSPEERVEWFESWVRRGFDFGFSSRTLATKFSKASFSDLDAFANDVARRQVLAGPGASPREVTNDVMRTRREQYTPPV
jgi:SpoVK/Ycf46/Vps4 family AAA+-type ATPase